MNFFSAIRYTGAIDVFRKTYYRDGIKGLYRGFGANLVKVVPAVGTSYVIYEKVKSVVT
jgi:solute carrier family 25 (mitochondrial phosphate transporter), member 23/24/25/41